MKLSSRRVAKCRLNICVFPDKFVVKYGITAEQIAINCGTEFAVYQPEQEILDPETLAEEFKST